MKERLTSVRDDGMKWWPKLPIGSEPMDRITESFLKQFAESSEITMLAQDQQFEHFASYVTMRRHYNGEAIDTSDVVTGSGGDTGIDGIAIIVNGSLVTDVESLEEHADLSGNFDVTFVFVQAERSSSSMLLRSELSDLGSAISLRQSQSLPGTRECKNLPKSWPFFTSRVRNSNLIIQRVAFIM